VADWESLVWTCHCDAVVALEDMGSIRLAPEIPSMLCSIALERSQMK
jgi:hypothetical protein